ncbi:MAG TPA: two-component regulator propeller domain-containing protein [Thermoanaerobaculia bacterium]|nr:two-component regulator propeller domain-containing protein [Thermoanaerobaculia bacterium]
MTGRGDSRLFLAAVFIGLLGAAPARGVLLPARVYSTLDGLPGDRVHRILRDSRGFLWFATDRGFARFDGTRFIVYGAADGLPADEIDDAVETKDGALWIAADDGLYRLDPLAPRGLPGGAVPFARYAAAPADFPSPDVLEVSGDAAVRVGTMDGVFETRGGPLVRSAPALPHRIWDDHAVTALARTPAGEWTGTIDALWFVPAGGGPSRKFELRSGESRIRISALLRDGKDRLWIGTWGGLFRLGAGEDGRGDPFDPSRRLSREPVSALLERPDGTIIAAAHHALLEFPPAGAPRRTPAGELGPLFESVELRCLAEDPAGNLWVGTAGGGAVRIDREGFLRYGREDGLVALWAPALFVRGGAPCTQLVADGRPLVACFDGSRFHSVKPRLPRESIEAGWGTTQLALEDDAGRLWLPTGEGLFRYPARERVEDLARVAPERTFDRKNGLAIDNVFRVFRSRDRNLWISTVSPERNLLVRWLVDSDRIEPIAESDGPARSLAVTAIGQDAGGAIWIGTNGGGIWRRRLDRFEEVGRDPAISRSWITSIFADRRGRLWVGTDRVGLLRFDAPDAERPLWRPMSTRDGLSTTDIVGVAEDRFSRMYALTSSGVDRFPSGGGSVEHFSAADGLPGGRLASILEDGDGTIWVSGQAGIAALSPVAAAPDAPVSVAFDRVEISGQSIPVPLRGKSRLTNLSLSAARNSMRFEIASLAWELRRSIAYRYRLDAKSPWNAVPPDRAIVLPRLAAGRYRLEVEGMDSAGAVGKGAFAEFSIAAPVWRRPWFVLLAAAALAGAAARIQRARILQLMRIERIRTRIAADLHDDIGAGLSEVAVLAEVVRRRLPGPDPESESLLGRVAEDSRQLVDSMSDIVWAVDPRRDDLASLVARLRHFSATLAEARGIRFLLEVSPHAAEVPLDAGRRRDLYLLLKEAAHNALRHSEARSVEMRISVERAILRGDVVDDGRGFDPAGCATGHGLGSMRSRASDLGGTLEIDSAPGRGTRVAIAVPLAGPA